MGIRIRKQIGYALTDVSSVEEDSRLNADSILLNWEKFSDAFDSSDDALKDYLRFIQVNDLCDIGESTSQYEAILEKGRSRSIEDCVVHFSEYQETRRIMLFIPYLYLKEWSRYDDMLDYVEASLKPDPTEVVVEELKGGIYPYSGSYVDKRTGKTPGGRFGSYKIMDLIRYVNDCKDKGIKPSTNEVRFVETLKELNLSSFEEFQEFIVPEVPQGIINVIKWGKVFTDEKYIYDLKPILYTYWS